jgi:hypothetical protein
MEPNLIYFWEMETCEGEIRAQYDGNKKEQTWKTLPLEKIVRVSFIPTINILPKHDILIDLTLGDRFIRRFGRGFLKQGSDGIKLREYINCCVTNKYRVWVFSSGRVIVTPPELEINL